MEGAGRGQGVGMEVLRCGSCNYLVLLILPRRGCDLKVSLFDHLFDRPLRTDEFSAPDCATAPSSHSRGLKLSAQPFQARTSRVTPGWARNAPFLLACEQNQLSLQLPLFLQNLLNRC